MKPGYYPFLSEDEHHAIPALSKSGIKKLLVSPMEYWASAPWNHDAERPGETRDMRLGRARHAMLLEGPERFAQRFAPAPTPEEFPGALRTVEDLREWLKRRGLKPPNAGGKAALVEAVLAVDPEAQIWDRIVESSQLDGKTLLPGDEFRSIIESEIAFRGVSERIGEGLPEVSVVWEDRALGCLCKARIDWLGISHAGHARLVELKDFSHQGRKCSLMQRTSQVFSHERHDIDALFQLRAIAQAPLEVHGATDAEAKIIRAVKEAPSHLLPQNHPEFVVLYHRKDGPSEFILRSVWISDQGGSYTDMGQIAWCSVLSAAETYNRYMHSHGTHTPWQTGWLIEPVEFEQTSLKYL